MRIECKQLEHFLENLKGESVFQNTVHVDKSVVIKNGNNPRDYVSAEIYFQASAILDYNGEGQSLIQVGEFCGVDIKTADGDVEGSLNYERKLTELRIFCDRTGLRLRPGILSE